MIRGARLSLAIALGLLLPTWGRAQFGALPGADTSPPDAPANIYRRERHGTSMDGWAHMLESADADRRLEIMDELGTSTDPRAITYLLKAIDDPDLRIEAKAIDYLGNRRSTDATGVLVRKLFGKDAPKAMRQHILTALGKIADPSASRPILDFVSQEPDPEVRGTAVYTLGEIGDLAVRDDLQQLSLREDDPRVKHIAEDALAKIGAQPRPSKQTFVPPSSGLVPPMNPATDPERDHDRD